MKMYAILSENLMGFSKIFQACLDDHGHWYQYVYTHKCSSYQATKQKAVGISITLSWFPEESTALV